MAKQKEENSFLFYVMLALIALGFILSFILPAHAEMRRFVGVLCDSQEQIENWATLFKNGVSGEDALKQINNAANNPIACGEVEVYADGIEVVKELTLGGEDAVLLKMMVVGVQTPFGPQQVMPVEQFGAAGAKGFVASKTRI